MAKKNNQRRAGGARGANWMDAFAEPSRGSFMSWMRGQRQQFNPAIGALRNAVAGLNPDNNELVKSYRTLLGEIPSADAVSGAFGKKKEEIARLIAGTDFGAGGRGVSDIVSGLGGTSDVATAAGTVSGMGGQGGDVYSKAITAGSVAKLSEQEADQATRNSDRRMQLMLGMGEAVEGSKSERRQMGLTLAETLGRRAGATPNPFDLANMIMSYQQNRRNLSGGGSGGGAGAGGAGADGAGAGPMSNFNSQLYRENLSMLRRLYGNPNNGGMGAEGAAAHRR